MQTECVKCWHVSQLADMRCSGISDLYITLRIYSRGEPLTLPFQTGTKVFKKGLYE